MYLIGSPGIVSPYVLPSVFTKLGRAGWQHRRRRLHRVYTLNKKILVPGEKKKCNTFVKRRGFWCSLPLSLPPSLPASVLSEAASYWRTVGSTSILLVAIRQHSTAQHSSSWFYCSNTTVVLLRQCSDASSQYRWILLQQ